MPILWLASFPKSGNTWVRALLANYFTGGEKPVGINTLQDFTVADTNVQAYERAAGRPLPNNATLEDIMPLKAKAQAVLAGPDPKRLVFAKTHTALRMLYGEPTISPAVTAGAIYIVRNPLDVTLSYADHFGLTHAQTVEAMASPSLNTPGRPDRAPEYLGDWSSHVSGWIGAKGLASLLLRYEDLQADSAACLEKVLRFLQQPVDADKVARAARHSSFETLANQEALTGFRERSRNQERFFRKGAAGQWRERLAPDLVDQVVAAHGEVMAKHGYLDEAGQPI